MSWRPRIAFLYLLHSEPSTPPPLGRWQLLFFVLTIAVLAVVVLVVVLVVHTHLAILRLFEKAVDCALADRKYFFVVAVLLLLVWFLRG